MTLQQKRTTIRRKIARCEEGGAAQYQWELVESVIYNLLQLEENKINAIDIHYRIRHLTMRFVPGRAERVAHRLLERA